MMHAPPHDGAVAARMRSAHRHACSALDVRPDRGGQEAWGWRGRTLSRPVTAPDGPAWLRLACSSTDQLDEVRTFWDGGLAAHETVPATIPRPRLRHWHDFHDTPWAYRAELYDRVWTRPIATRSVLTAQPDLPAAWWGGLRDALEDLATISTQRVTSPQHYFDWAMPRFLGQPLNATAPSWTTAHGDLHWANLNAPTLQILDWEGWGLAPTGYDAAVLHSHSLLVPSVAARIRREFAHILQTPTGRFAELAAITELLHNATHGDNLELVAPLRARASQLLERAVPAPQ